MSHERVGKKPEPLKYIPAEFLQPVDITRGEKAVTRRERVTLIGNPLEIKVMGRGKEKNLLGIKVTDGKETTNLLLEYKEIGDPEGWPIIFNHGTPGTIDDIGISDEVARSMGLRIIAFNRPGYGDSTLHKGRTVADNATYAEAILKAKGITKCSAFGRSGGGPGAMAQGVLLDEVVNVAVASGLTPPEAQVDNEGMSESNKKAFGVELRKEREDLLRKFKEESIASYRNPGIILNYLGPEMCPSDESLVIDHRYAYLRLAQVHAAGLQGYGYIARFDDTDAMKSPWGFDVTELNKPTFLYYGSDDTFTPRPHYEWFMKNLRNVPREKLIGYLDHPIIRSATGYRNAGHFGTYLMGDTICDILKEEYEGVPSHFQPSLRAYEVHREILDDGTGDRSVASSYITRVTRRGDKPPDYHVSTIRRLKEDRCSPSERYETMVFEYVPPGKEIRGRNGMIIYQASEEPRDLEVLGFTYHYETQEEATEGHTKIVDEVLALAA